MTPLESKAALGLVVDDSVDSIEWTLRRTSGSFESRRLQLLDTGTALVAYYSEGSAALAADFYEDARSDAGVRGNFAARAVVLDRTVNIRRGFAWAAEPLSIDNDVEALNRLTDVMRSEVVRPYRDTVLSNRLRDSQAVGYKRIASSSACGFCRMLAARGAVYREATAYFAAHGNCQCTVQPWFRGQPGQEANVIEYIASRRKKTPAQRERVRQWIAAEYPDEADRRHIRTSR